MTEQAPYIPPDGHEHVPPTEFVVGPPDGVGTDFRGRALYPLPLDNPAGSESDKRTIIGRVVDEHGVAFHVLEDYSLEPVVPEGPVTPKGGYFSVILDPTTGSRRFEGELHEGTTVPDLFGADSGVVSGVQPAVPHAAGRANPEQVEPPSDAAALQARQGSAKKAKTPRTTTPDKKSKPSITRRATKAMGMKAATSVVVCGSLFAGGAWTAGAIGGPFSEESGPVHAAKNGVGLAKFLWDVVK